MLITDPLAHDPVKVETRRCFPVLLQPLLAVTTCVHSLLPFYSKADRKNPCVEVQECTDAPEPETLTAPREHQGRAPQVPRYPGPRDTLGLSHVRGYDRIPHSSAAHADTMPSGPTVYVSHELADHEWGRAAPTGTWNVGARAWTPAWIERIGGTRATPGAFERSGRRPPKDWPATTES